MSNSRLVLALTAGVALAGCTSPIDFDLRGRLGAPLDTSEAAVTATAERPAPDRRGVISYPNYQVAVARRGDSVIDVADRIGMDAKELASFNGLQVDDQLRRGEVLALPHRVAEPSPETGAAGTGPILPPDELTSLANSAIDAAAPSVTTDTLEPATPAAVPQQQTGVEPVRHKVVRGETAYTISRLYNISVRSLAEWNGLGSDFAIREGQYLLIPVALPDTPVPETTQPGQGSPTPTPPSATQPLPDEEPLSVNDPVPTPPAPKLETSTASSAQMVRPVSNGRIIREYAKGKNNGIDFAADAGAPVRAADAGRVAAITVDADQVTIVVVRHEGNLMTVYYNVADVAVKKDQQVSRGETLASIPSGDSYVHFEVRKGFDSVDPMPYIE